LSFGNTSGEMALGVSRLVERGVDSVGLPLTLIYVSVFVTLTFFAWALIFELSESIS
jgi:hypothetical protein